MNKELLKNYCNNTCTETELDSVLKWFETSSMTAEGKNQMIKILEQMPDEECDQETDFNSILDKIHHKVNLLQSKELLEKSDNNIFRYKRIEKYVKVLTRVAAVLMIPVICFALFTTLKYKSLVHNQVSVNKTYNEVFSSVDAITKVTLPDGSNVWLNHSSSLKYPASFQGDFRTVELSGEGYFEVAHNRKIPFMVKAGEIQVLARGTTFNILAYPDEDRIETSLINGEVELRMMDTISNTVRSLKMNPSDLVVYQKEEKNVITRVVKDDRYYSWKEGKLIFKKEPMSEVVKKLERWFNVDIMINDPELLDLTYTATFEQETLPEVMELLTMATPIVYTISKRHEIDNGIFSKRKVTLSYRKK